MISIDLLVNLVIAPIGFLLLVVIRERLHRVFLAPAAQRANRKRGRAATRRTIVWSQGRGQVD